MNKRVTSLELSKKLKELGAKQESEFYYKVDKVSNISNLISKYERQEDDKYFEYYSAFMSCELGVILPPLVKIWKTLEWEDNHIVGQKWACSYWLSDDDYSMSGTILYGHTEAEARGNMFSFLLREKPKLFNNNK